MKKFSDFICKNKNIVLIISFVLLALSFVGMKLTKINYDILVYLPSDIETIEGQDILTNEFNMGAYALVVAENVDKEGILKLENQIKKIIEYVNNNYTSPDISIKKIADNFYFSQAYLTRIFKKNTGISPMKYIIMLRMRRAVELLNKESFSIAQIAYCVGYKNQFYFSKEFKQYFGMPPSKYLNSTIS